MTADAWRAFEYEVQMFYATRARLKDPGLDTIVHNALVESSLLHTRILVDALLGRSGKSDDVTLHQLLPSAAASRDFECSLAKLKNVYGSYDLPDTPCWILNKRLAHLTRVRGDSFDYPTLYATLDPLVRAILGQVAGIAKRPLLSHYCA